MPILRHLGPKLTTIDASHQDPATAYVSMDAHAVGDMTRNLPHA